MLDYHTFSSKTPMMMLSLGKDFVIVVFPRLLVLVTAAATAAVIGDSTTGQRWISELKLHNGLLSLHSELTHYHHHLLKGRRA